MIQEKTSFECWQRVTLRLLMLNQMNFVPFFKTYEMKIYRGIRLLESIAKVSVTPDSISYSQQDVVYVRAMLPRFVTFHSPSLHTLSPVASIASAEWCLVKRLSSKPRRPELGDLCSRYSGDKPMKIRQSKSGVDKFL